ncbi:MAG: HAD family hydrolase [Proteobacteria bacterium]|nr:HAD family hydrolase [Pseudomonadota bacterium]
MAPDLIIFDCDGVLVDSEMIACRVVAECLTELGFPLETADIVKFVGKSSADMCADLGTRYGRPLPAGLDDLLAVRRRAAFERELTAMPGAVAVLDALAGTRMCVASSSSPARIRHSLGCVGLLDRFESALFSAAMVARGKPAPDLFLHAAARMGAPPAACVVIEDSVPGIAGAVAAGMTAIGFTGGAHCRLGHASTLRRAGARSIARSMAALGALLEAH